MPRHTSSLALLLLALAALASGCAARSLRHAEEDIPQDDNAGAPGTNPPYLRSITFHWTTLDGTYLQYDGVFQLDQGTWVQLPGSVPSGVRYYSSGVAQNTEQGQGVKGTLWMNVLGCADKAPGYCTLALKFNDNKFSCSLSGACSDKYKCEVKNTGEQQANPDVIVHHK